jgi:hypothetical protein
MKYSLSFNTRLVNKCRRNLRLYSAINLLNAEPAILATPGFYVSLQVGIIQVTVR